MTGTDDAEYRAMLQFGDSTVRLAEIARQAGYAVEAIKNSGHWSPGLKHPPLKGSSNATASSCWLKPVSHLAYPSALSCPRSVWRSQRAGPAKP